MNVLSGENFRYAIVYIFDRISMLLILSIIVSIKRLLLPLMFIESFLRYTVRFERLFLKLLQQP